MLIHCEACHKQHQRPERARWCKKFHADILKIVQSDPPWGCRQVFYQAVVRNIVDGKTAAGAADVNRALRNLREFGVIPFTHIEDHGREVNLTPTWESVGDRLRTLYYARDFWQDREDRPFIFIEKDGLLNTIASIANQWQVPYTSGHGDASWSLLYTMGTEYLTQHSTVYVFSDLDYKGEGSIFTKISEFLERHCDLVPQVKRWALTEQQVKQYRLPKRPPKAADHRSYAVELDALPKAVLKQLVEDCIRNHVTDDEWAEHEAAEEAGQEQLRRIAKRHWQK